MRGTGKSAERRSPNRRGGGRPQVNAGSETGAPAALREEAPPYTVAAVCDRRAEDRRAGEERRSQSAATGLGQGPALRFIDLFCGIGGFRLAFERAGARCVFSSDWDRFSQQTYAANFGETPHGDIHSVAVADIPQFDILCGGFPCQPFSLAGISKKLSLGLNPCGISSHGARPENSAPAKLHHPHGEVLAFDLARGDVLELRTAREPPCERPCTARGCSALPRPLARCHKS